MKVLDKLKSKICKCEEQQRLIDCQKITINRSELKLYIREHNESQKTKQSWHLPLTIALSLLIALATTSFQPHINIPISNYTINIPSGMSSVLWFALTLSTIWTIIAFCKSRAAKDPTETLLQQIDSSILNRPDRTSIFIIKKTNLNDDIKLLVEQKGSWACFFLPYVKQSNLTIYSADQKTGTTKSLANKLGLNANNIKIELLHEFNFKSEKFDPPQKVVKEYHFEVFHVEIAGIDLSGDEYRAGDRKYYWKTLNELEEDAGTKRNNKDILNHLRDNYNDLIVRVSNYDA